MKGLYVFGRVNKRLNYCSIIARGCISFISLISLYLFSTPASAFYTNANLTGFSVSAEASAAAAIQRASSSAQSAAKFVQGVLQTSASVGVGTGSVSVGARAVAATAAGVTIARALMFPAAFLVAPLLMDAASEWFAKSDISLNRTNDGWEKQTTRPTAGYCYDIPGKARCNTGGEWVSWVIDYITNPETNPCLLYYSPTSGCKVDVINSQVIDPNAIVRYRTTYYGGSGSYYIDSESVATGVYKTTEEVVTLPVTVPDIVKHAEDFPVPDAVLNTYVGKILLDALDVHGITTLGAPYLDSDGKTWVQDKVAVTSAYTADDPSRVNVEVTKVQPNSVADDNAGTDIPISDPDTPPNPDPDPDPNPDSDSSVLCDIFPNVLACDTMGTLNDENIPKETKTLSVGLDATFSSLPSDCPPSIVVGGHTFDYPCDALRKLRPVVFAVAGLIAVSIAIAALRM